MFLYCFVSGLVSSVLSQDIDREERLRNDLFYIELDVKPLLSQWICSTPAWITQDDRKRSYQPCSFEDMRVSMLCEFGLKFTTHAHFGVFWGKNEGKRKLSQFSMDG